MGLFVAYYLSWLETKPLHRRRWTLWSLLIVAGLMPLFQDVTGQYLGWLKYTMTRTSINPSLPTNWPKIPNDYHIGKLDQNWLRRANSSPGRKVLLGQLRRFGSLQLTWSLAHAHVVGKFCFFMGFAEPLMGKPSKYRGLDSFSPYSWWFLANPMQCKKPGWNWEMTICRSVYWVF